MAAQLGGEVEGGHHREFGRADVEVKAASQPFDNTWSMGERHPVWMSHGDRITKMLRVLPLPASRRTRRSR
jgi:GMP synthase (glutamine-hydrolysing)